MIRHRMPSAFANPQDIIALKVRSEDPQSKTRTVEERVERGSIDPRHEGFPTQTRLYNPPAQKMVRALKFRIKEVEGLSHSRSRGIIL